MGLDIITLPILFSLIYFCALTIYLEMGVYIFALNKKSIKNIIFLFTCMSMCVWSFAFSMANSAIDYGTALLWMRVAAIGWGIMFSFLVHFILVLTENEKILHIRGIYFLLYLPAIVNVCIFSLFSDLAVEMYNLTNTSLGWSLIPSNSILNLYFKIYGIAFAIASIGLLVNWSKRTNDQKNKKVAVWLIASFMIAVGMGAITEIIVNIYLSAPIPQLAPVIILIPIASIFYYIKHYEQMKSVKKSQTSAEGVILNEVNRLKLYRYIAQLYIMVIALNFIYSYFIRRDSLESVVLYISGFIFCILFIRFINHTKLNNNSKDMILFFLISLSIPYIIVRFIEYASITVWVVPVVFLMLTILFNKRRLIIILSVAIMLTLGWVWIKAPMLTVQVSSVDHLIRILIFAIIIIMTLYINRILAGRIKENDDKTSIQKMISQISADFVTVSKANLDEKIWNMLQLSGEHYRVDRASLLLFSKDKKKIIYTDEWCNNGIKPYTRIAGGLAVDAFPWWMNQILASAEVHIPDMDMLPPEANEEKKLLKKLQILSLLSVPVRKKNEVVGFLNFEAVKNEKTWRDDHREILKILVNIMADALTKVDAEEKIKHMAFYDALTGLPNRMLFKDRLTEAIHLAKRTEKMIGVLFIDLDSFKAVNDTMCHEAGDELLKQVASRLPECVRKYDSVARFGGDEFLILLANIARTEDIFRIADKIMRSFEQPMIIRDQEFFVTASVGIAIFPIDGEESEELIKNADLAMYSSKAQGKSKYTLYSQVMKEDVLNKNKLINSLYRAQERNELVLHYQPQVSVVTKYIIGLEALIRWQHPDMGMILPEIFIPLAEQTGLINPIGEWVLMTACRQNRVWQEMGIPPIRMAVNLSVEQFRNPNLLDTVNRALSETGLKPEYLELEITESIAVKESGYFINVLNQLKELGVTIAIDDFGSEYSSLSRLKMLPIDRLKMDMQFVQGISTNYMDDAIAKVIIQLGRSLALKVIAEGVETEQQLDYLTNQVCDEVQGYYYYKPMPAEEIEAILLKQYKQK